MKTLLKREWSQQMLQQVPASFITQVLLPALLSPLHHNTQPMSNLARSGAVVDPHKQQHNNSSIDSDSDAFDVTQQTAQLLRSYVVCAGPAAAREVFSGGLQVANLLKQDASRAGLQSVLQVLAVAAEQLQTAGPGLLDGLTAADAGKCGQTTTHRQHGPNRMSPAAPGNTGLDVVAASRYRHCCVLCRCCCLQRPLLKPACASCSSS
jgi:hypothetical protein